MAADPEWASPIHGQVQLMMAVYDSRRGWLTVKGSIIKGGRHGEPALIEESIEDIEKALAPEVRAGLRAMQRRWFGG